MSAAVEQTWSSLSDSAGSAFSTVVWIIVGVVGGVIVLLVLCCLIACCYRKRVKGQQIVTIATTDYPSTNEYAAVPQYDNSAAMMPPMYGAVGVSPGCTSYQSSVYPQQPQQQFIPPQVPQVQPDWQRPQAQVNYFPHQVKQLTPQPQQQQTPQSQYFPVQSEPNTIVSGRLPDEQAGAQENLQQENSSAFQRSLDQADMIHTN